MSKQAQYEEQQQFLPPQSQHQVPLQAYPQAQAYGTPVYTTIVGDSDEVRRARSTCCTPCWSIFIAIMSSIAIIGGLYSYLSCMSAGNSCMFPFQLPVNIAQLVFAFICARVYFATNPTASQLGAAYFSWIALSVLSALLSLGFIVIATIATISGVTILVYLGTGDLAAQLGAALMGIVWGIAAVALAPLIINSVLAHKNKAPVCGGASQRY